VGIPEILETTDFLAIFATLLQTAALTYDTNKLPIPLISNSVTLAGFSLSTIARKYISSLLSSLLLSTSGSPSTQQYVFLTLT